MEVMRVEQRNALLIDPNFFGKTLAFGAVPVSAGVIGDTLVPAVVTCVYMSAKRRCPTVHNVLSRLLLDGPHVVLRGIIFKVRGEDVLYFNGHCSQNNLPG